MTEIGARCQDCEWAETAPTGAGHELNLAMIDHFLETGHTVVREDGPERSPPPGEPGASACEYE